MAIQDFLKRIENKEITVGVIGLGYVGLPLAVEFAAAGFRTIGLDINVSRVQQINRGENYIQDVDDSRLRILVKQGTLSASTNYADLERMDAVAIAVPTPLNKTKDPDVSYLLQVAEQIRKYVHRDFLVVLESTTYPGTTRELLLPAIESKDLKVGEDVFLLFSPERVDPGNKRFNTKNTPKIMGGVTPNCLRLGLALYEQVIDQMVPVSSPEAAELTKLLENTFRSINIGLANEMALMADKLGVNVWEVIDAANTKPFGFMKFTPGPGLGGHCIPIDPHYLSWKMKTLNYRARFIELASEINAEMPYYVVDLVGEGLNRSEKSIKGSRVLLLGMAYKPDIDDVRESPALDIHEILLSKGAIVSYHDFYVPQVKFNGREIKSIELSEEILENQDCVVITTNHSRYDWEWIVKHSKLVVDTRNATRRINSDRIIRLGASKLSLNNE